MSVRVSSWVWENAPVKSGELVVLLALADCAHDDGTGAYPSRESLAVKSRMTARQVGNCTRSLTEKGLIRKQGLTAGGVVVWAINMGEENFSPRKPASAGGGSQLPTEPSVEASALSLQARGSTKPVKYRGKKVPEPIVEMASYLLGVFAVHAGRSCRSVTATGEPTPELKQVIGALLARPDATRDDWERAIKNTAANPPDWAEGPLKIGTVFGERAAEWALTNDGKPKSKNGKATDSSKAQRDLERAAAVERLMGGGDV